jgi:pilus assembly protein Flp/PilA
MFNRFTSREEGQGLVEYALILVLVAIVVIAILLQLGPAIGDVFCQVANTLKPGSCAITGSGNYDITFNGTPSVDETPDGFGCKYTATVSVNVTEDGAAANGVPVNGTVSILNDGGNTVGSISLQGTTDSSGQVTLSNSSTINCSGEDAIVTIPGGPSLTVEISD